MYRFPRQRIAEDIGKRLRLHGAKEDLLLHGSSRFFRWKGTETMSDIKGDRIFPLQKPVLSIEVDDFNIVSDGTFSKFLERVDLMVVY